MPDWRETPDSYYEDFARRNHPIFGETDEEIRAHFADAEREAERQSALFDGLETYCMFIGYPYSGHSLVGSLLDAHESMAISHELHALKFLDAGFNERQLYAVILENAKRFGAFGRVWGKYAYAVPDQRQGRFNRLTVIGDKKGSGSTIMIGRDFNCLNRLRRDISLQQRYVHIIRNPFDNIATIAENDPERLPWATKFYFDNHRTNLAIIDAVGSANIIHIRSENLIAGPQNELVRLCGFLGVTAGDTYLDACTQTVAKTPSKTRHLVPWTPKLRKAIRANIERYHLLRGYTFKD